MGRGPVALYGGLEESGLIVGDRAQAFFHAPHELEGEFKIESRREGIGGR